MTQLMSQILTMHCMLMQCAGVSTWESQPMNMAPRRELSPPFWPHHTDPCPRNGYDAHLADDDTMSVGMPDIDIETVLGAPTLDSHSPYSYIQSAKAMVATVDMKCHNLRSTQGSDGSTQPAIKEGSVATINTIGKCHNLGFTQGSDGLTHTTLQDGRWED